MIREPAPFWTQRDPDPFWTPRNPAPSPSRWWPLGTFMVGLILVVVWLAVWLV